METHEIGKNSQLNPNRWLGGKVIDQWDGFYNSDVIKKSYIQYLKIKANDGSIAQIVYRDRIIRRINVDENGDGLQEYMLIDENGDGNLDKKSIFIPEISMIDWKKEALD
ncbi:hypothetical protein [Desulfotalea psychrophila]|uniref:hypothetical protein n=1 Tax=Desulfotalea psychrophila TaxID=84980 RepID=UPI0002FD81B1|nr:hypothetical protein [Desulfotalea psychrophila]